MLLKELLTGLNYLLFDVCDDTEISVPFSDSRMSEDSGLFICLDGNEMNAREAVRSGAAAVVAQRRIRGVPCVVVGDVRYASACIRNNYFESPAKNMRLYGITGTNGKTSVARFLEACLLADGRSVGSIGTLGCFANGELISACKSEKANASPTMTTPDPRYLYGTLAAFREMGITDVVMEVSSHAVALRKVDALSFCTGIFTNLTPEHLDFHKDMEEYFRVKASFVARCEKRIVNVEDAWCRRFSAAVPSFSVGLFDVCDLKVETGGVSYKAFDKKVNIASSVGGDFTVINTLLAVKAAALAGVSVSVCEKGIASVKSVRGRVERVVKYEEDGFDVIIDYAHTPAALESILLHLRKTCKGCLICVFGCGGERDKTKRPVMGKIANDLADGVIVTSDNSRGEDPLEIIKNITDGMSEKGYVVIPDRRKAIFAAVAMAGEGDTVLLAGKGHETYEIVSGKVMDFDEREVVREAVRVKKGK